MSTSGGQSPWRGPACLPGREGGSPFIQKKHLCSLLAPPFCPAWRGGQESVPRAPCWQCLGNTLVPAKRKAWPRSLPEVLTPENRVNRTAGLEGPLASPRATLLFTNREREPGPGRRGGRRLEPGSTPAADPVRPRPGHHGPFPQPSGLHLGRFVPRLALAAFCPPPA